MLKMRLFSAILASSVLMSPVVAVDATVLGPDSAQCNSGSGPAILVNVNGFRNRSGKVRARTFAGNNPAGWFEKKFFLKRTEIEVPDTGQVEICMPVSRSGGYVVDIRHDLNNNGSTDKADGIGASGNPKVTMWDIILRRKPSASQVVVQVGQGVTEINVNLRYAG